MNIKIHKPILIECKQRSQDWFKFREGKIGASDASAIMGINPWVTKLQCWEEKVLGKKKAVTRAMERGIKYEPEALAWFNQEVGNLFTPQTFQHEDHPDLIASLDGWNDEVHVEIKTPGKFSTSVPDYYFPQIQHQMMVMGTPYGWYVEYQPDLKTGWYVKVPRDDYYIHDLLAEELVFLASMIDMRAPEPSDKDWVTIVDPRLIMAAVEYKEAALEIKILEEKQKELRKILLAGVTSSRSKCGTAKIQHIWSKGTIDYKKFMEDYKITDQEKYRKDRIEKWVIS